MKLSYSKILLMALFPLMGTTLYAAEKISATNVVDDDHAYETVTHTDDKKEGYLLGEGWKVTGDMRMGYVNYDYSNSPKNPDSSINKGHLDSKGIYVIPKVSIASPDYNGFSFKITGAGVTDFGINDEIYETRTFAFGADGSSYAILQEAYIQYDKEGHTFMVGAKEISTPMLDADDWYLLANSFQAAYYKNTTIENITFAGGYIYKMAGVWDSGADGAAYHSIADTSYVDQRDKDNAGDAGMWAGVFQYAKDEHTLQVWDYYAVDLYNTFFAQYDFAGTYDDLSYDLGGQVINFKEVGGNSFTPIDYSIYSLRFDGKFDNGFDFSTGASFYTDGPGVGATLGAWGGYPYWANGMIFHFFEAGDLTNANSYKAQVGYDFSKQGVEGLWVGARYTYFDLDPKYSISSSNGLGQDSQNNYGLRVSYNDPSGIYFTGTYELVNLDHQDDISALRLIGGYKF
jgi:hypothetical protein